MASVEKYDDLIIGSGIAGKFAAWTRDSRRRTAIVEQRSGSMKHPLKDSNVMSSISIGTVRVRTTVERVGAINEVGKQTVRWP